MTEPLWAQPRTPGDLGNYLARLRHQRGWTQDELAELLGTSRRYVYEIESGQKNIYNERLFRLLRILGARLTIEADPVHASHGLPHPARRTPAGGDSQP
jgi:HTH-type transcriptional regulator/antitoxin HipB